MPDFHRYLQRGRTLLLALLASTLAVCAFAQDDPPGRIGRIAWLSGNVFLNNPETGELSAATLNQPLTSGDIITTGAGARAEIQVGAMTLRLDARSRIEFERLDDEQFRLFLDDGRIIAKLPTEDTRRDFVLETGHGRFLPRSTGIYRFDADAAGSTSATAYFGTLRFEGRDLALDINAGESARLWPDASGQLHYQMAQGSRDEFTQWSAARDQRARTPAYARYVSPEMTGAQDLDAYGDWSETPEYGAVWFPRDIAADWAPYRTGHWAWVAPWGWTWVGHEPWGFAPFHYGRWVRIQGLWAWAPGTRIARPVYAPALVAWIGTPGFGVSAGIGPVGWFPLAPREVYVPFYRSSHTHVRVVNAPHVPHIRNLDEIIARPHEVVRHSHFAHRDEPRALSVAPSDAFRQRRPEARITPRPGEMREFRARLEHVAPPVPEAPRMIGGELRTRPEQRPRIEAPLQQARPNSPGEGASMPRGEHAMPGVFRQPAPEARREAPLSEMPREPVRSERPQPPVSHPEFQMAPPAARAMPSERPPEVRREPPPRVEMRQERREERAQPREERRERRENREERRDDRHERGRPGERERR